MQVGTDGRLNRYSALRPVYALNILGYTHFNDDEALRILELCDQKRNKRLEKELIRIAFFELTKTLIETENQRHWRHYFITGEASPDAPEYIKKASKIIEYANLSEEERFMMSALERLEANEQAERGYVYLEGLTKGKAEGIAEGKTEGKKEKAMEIAKLLFKLQITMENISNATNLDVVTLQKLKEENI
jgi:predicted transposase/invertase (TIGR01784 family)